MLSWLLLFIRCIVWLARNAFRLSSASPCIHATLSRITSLVAMSGMHSNGSCTNLDFSLLNKFLIPPTSKSVKDIVLVVWKPATITWVKANTDGSVIEHNAYCGGIFFNFRGTFLGLFASNVGRGSVFEAKLLGLIFAMEFAAKHNWNRLWFECDSSSVVDTFKNPDVIPIRLRNRWHNCFLHGMMVHCSHIFQEGNCCANKLASLGHVLIDTVWYTNMPSSLAADFSRDRNGLPNYRFP